MNVVGSAPASVETCPRAVSIALPWASYHVRVTSPRGRILATTRQPGTTNPRHRSYLRCNLERGRAIGQIRLRLVYGGKRGAWFELLLLSPTDLMEIAAKEKWELAHVFPLDSLEEGYSVVLEKRR